MSEEELKWRKSSRSNGQNNCVEAATAKRRVALRDSKHPENGMILLDGARWRILLGEVKAGSHDLA